MSASFSYPPEILDAIRQRQSFSLPQLGGYKTKGGSYMVTSGALADDSGKARDLMVITPWGVIRLAPNVDPNALARALNIPVLS